MRIYITGIAGSGKSTYANKLGKELNIPVYSTDDLFFKDLNRMYNLEEIEKTIPINSDWIIEGAYYIPQYVKEADKVIYLKTSLLGSIFRIWKRRYTNSEVRKKYSFWKTVRLTNTTIKNRYASVNVQLDTLEAKHYNEREMFALCEKNAKVFEEVRVI